MKMVKRLVKYAVLIATLPAFAGFPFDTQAQTTWGELNIGPGETVVIGAGVERRHIGPINVFGGGRLEVNGGKLFLNGTLTIVQNGEVVFDAGEFHHEGNYTNVLVGGRDETGGDGLLAFRNGGRYHFDQTYVSQHELHARNNSKIELDRTKINSDAGTMVVRLFDQATYSAIGTETQKGSWLTWYMSQTSKLLLNWVKNAGDIVFYDAVTIDVHNTIGVMPWLYFPSGSVADLSFPEALQCDEIFCPHVSKKIDATTVSGIEWSVNIVNSAMVMWSMNPNPGSNVTVRDSTVAAAMVRLAQNHIYVVPGEFRNNTRYEDKTFTSIPDRLLRLVNTTMQWWKVDVIDNAQARIDNITFAEMMVKDDARAFLTNSTCEGQTIHLGAINNGYVYFKDGEVWTHVSAWDNAFMVLDGSLVNANQGEFKYQIRNIAHGSARLYALNSEFVDFITEEKEVIPTLPEAKDAALVMFARLGSFLEKSLETTTATWTNIRGSAWIAKGPWNHRVAFDRWALDIRAPGSLAWTNFANGMDEKHDKDLAWLPPWLIAQPGIYQLRLTVFVSGDNPFTPHPTSESPAVKTLVVR